MKVIGVLLLVFFVAGFVVAVGSEVSTNFVVSDGADDEVRVDVSQEGFWNDYGEYVVGGLIGLVILYFVFRDVKRKKVSGKSARASQVLSSRAKKSRK